MIIIPNRVINPLYECTNTIIAKATLPPPAAKILRIHQNKNRGEQILNLLKIHKIKIIIRLGWICPMIGRMLDLSMLGRCVLISYEGIIVVFAWLWLMAGADLL